jgi:hypothetical protein
LDKMSTTGALGSSRLRATVPLLGQDFAAVSEHETIEYVLEALADGCGG